MRTLIGYRPMSFGQRRVHLAAPLTLDTGLRLSEMLHLRHADVDFDNLILKVFGRDRRSGWSRFLAGVAEAAVSVRAAQGAEGPPQPVRLRGLSRDALA